MGVKGHSQQTERQDMEVRDYDQRLNTQELSVATNIDVTEPCMQMRSWSK